MLYVGKLNSNKKLKKKFFLNTKMATMTSEKYTLNNSEETQKPKKKNFN